MDTSLLICDHSYHDKAFTHNLKSGLQHYLFRLQTEGSCKVYSSGKEFILTGGDLLLLQPGDDYHLVVDEPHTKERFSSGDYYLFCQGSWIDDWWKRRTRPVVNRIGIDDKLIGLWRNLLLEKRRGSLEEDAELKDVLLRSLCLYMDRAITDNIQTDRRGAATQKLKRFIEEHATLTFKLEEAASYAGLSLSRAVRLFKEHYDKTMIQYAIEIRLRAAEEQIRYSEMTLEHIAETCGFASYSYFHRVFRAHFGVSPMEYRTLKYLS
ncbi:helix-turn-helix domain-containing protein [Paenibacillus sp. HJL G12]|uniref:Helix-turn-helix domain-containing protein n=1 Tax=Paenibacillus dendrobii TaxID=2691084 RepID=A0A7X3LE55_9BACL|nr:AraC family transcriptional regulator [Paenibacillus dendrobii]MWV42186.1 helix-turn-helix domain-containing protein [Paenibacillus dendrobii]